MMLSPLDILYRNLGIQTVVNEISKKEKFRRKKIHRRFKMRICECKNDNGQVPSNAQHVGKK